MRSRRPNPEHQEAVSRRLALLSAELATVRPAVEEVDVSLPAPAGDTHTRIRAVPADPSPSVGGRRRDEPAVPVVPVPGRHARPGVRAGLGDLVPETLRGRAGIGQGAVTVVALALCAGLALTCWWLVRSEPQEVAAPDAGSRLVEVPAAGVATPSGAASAVASATSEGSGGAPAPPVGEVTVDVAGEVRRPGIAVLPAGSRVVDALDAAGGARRGTDLTSLNLARVLVDGEQVLVGRAPAAGPATSVGPGAGVPAPSALVNLNTADQAGLETLPGVGPVTAGSIIAWRTQHGGFTSVEELLEVDGIGDATLADLAPLVTI